jgi:sugar lactone lactonase YvrE
MASKLLRSVLAVTTAVVGGVALLAGPAAATVGTGAITLPGATGTEGVAAAGGTGFYAGDLLTGDVYLGDIRTGTAAKVVHAPAGRWAVGMKADLADHLLFVAGGPTGDGYVYDTRSGSPVAAYHFASAPTFVNDVALVPGGAWFTDSSRATLYFVPVVDGVPGALTTLALSGPAADTSGAFNNNGIQATADGRWLLVAHTGQGAVNVVDPTTGTSRALPGVSVPNVDGILLSGRTLWAVRNFDNEVVQFQLAGDLSGGTQTAVLTSPLFEVPTTVARLGDRLVVANAKFDTGLPPTAPSYEAVVIRR